MERAAVGQVASPRARVRVVDGREGRILSATFSTDGSSVIIVTAYGAAEGIDRSDGFRVWKVALVTHVPHSVEKKKKDDLHGQALRGEKCELIFHGRVPGTNSASFSTDGSRLVTTHSLSTYYCTAAKIWDICTGECLQTLHGHRDRLTAASFSTDCSRTVTASWDRTAKIWETYSGECCQTLYGHQGHVTSAMFSADSDLIVTASFDGTAKIWDTWTGECKQTLNTGSILDELNTGLYCWAAFSMN